MGRREADLDAGVGFVDVFIEVGFHDTIVVDAQPFAKSVLGDLETAVHITPQCRGEVETNGKGESTGLQPGEQGCPVRHFRQRQPDELADVGFI